MSTGLLAALLSLAVSAPADPPRAPRAPAVATLTLTRLDDTVACGDKTSLVAKVEHILSRAPFVDDGAPLAFVVTTRRRGRDWEARLQLTDVTNPNRVNVGERLIRAPRRTCDVLDETVALALAVALDPLAALTAPPRPDEPSEPPRPRVHRPAETEQRFALPRAPPESSPTEAQPDTDPPLFAPSFGLEALIGFAPDVTVGPTLGVAARFSPFFVELAAHIRTSVATDLGPTAVAVFAPTASLGLCVGPETLGACLGIEGGAFTASEQTSTTRPHAALTASFFASLGATRLSALVGVPLGRQRLIRDGAEAWEMPVAFFGLAVEWTPRRGRETPTKQGDW